MKLTKASVDKLPFPETGQVFYRDNELKGFALRVTKSAKSYIAETSVRGKSCRVTIGKHGAFSPEQARKIARKLLVDMAQGINPNLEKAQQRMRGTTLSEAFSAFMQDRVLAEKTRYEYTRCFTTVLKDWHNKPLTELNRPLISKRYTDLCDHHGAAYANLSMRFLSALLNYARANYEDSAGNPLLPHNPVQVLSDKQQWRSVSRRDNVIKPHQLAAWWQAVQNLSNITVRDYLILLVLTGLRKQEAAHLQWQDIDLVAHTLIVRNTKNSEPHTLPLSDYLLQLLNQRQLQGHQQWVFATKKGQPLVEFRYCLHAVTQQSGISFTCHDLRRTFATIAESLDLSAYAIKRLLNHKQQRDVTSGYIINDTERLREPMQRITDFVLAKVAETS